MMRTFKESKEVFLKKTYITCDFCGYNNEKSRFLKYGKCLKCGHILDNRTYFMIEMMKKIKDNKRKTR